MGRLDPVEQHLVLATEVALHERQCVLRHDHPVVESIGDPAQRRAEEPVARRPSGGVERPDGRRGVQGDRRDRRTRRERFVDVDHVERLVAQHPQHAQRRRRVGSERCHRTVRRRRKAVAERRDERFGRRAVAGSEDAHLVALASQFASETEHLRLYSARNRQAVRTDHPDPHQVARPRSRRRHRSGVATSAVACRITRRTVSDESGGGPAAQMTPTESICRKRCARSSASSGFDSR